MRDHDDVPMDDFEIADPVPPEDEASPEAWEEESTDDPGAGATPGNDGTDTEESEKPFTSAS